MKNNHTIQFYEPTYSGSFPLANYYLDTFNKLPNVLDYDNVFDANLCEEFETSPYLEKINETIHISLEDKKHKGKNTTYKSKQGGKFLVTLGDEYDGKIHRVAILYSDRKEVAFIENILENSVKNTKISSIGLILKDEMGLTIRDFKISAGKTFDVKKNYNDDFESVSKKIIKDLSVKNNKGLVLLHGKPGTGKTTYIKYLCEKLNKQIIFVPPMMSLALADPGFVPFLMKYPNSILIIEDAENIVKDRTLHSNGDAISNILNITDGILGECLNVQIVATFNTDRTQIDEALTRKGRLLAEYQFDKLDVKKTNNLLSSLGNKEKVDKPLSLADIYNYKEEPTITNNKPGIGFLINNKNDKLD
jgi:energy-coupling factor transporter ATP-binding protein EcfA2